MAKRTEEQQQKAKGPQEQRLEQPRPKIPLLSGGKDPTLAERFEEELRRSSS